MTSSYHFNRIAEAIRFLSAHYKEQPDLNEVARHVHLSRYHFQRLFQRWAGVTPKQFLRYVTLEHAKKCLQEGRTTLETAYQIGLSGNGRLHDLFINIEACTPGEYKNRGKDIKISYDYIDTAFGRALVAETEIGICKLSFYHDESEPELELKNDFPEADFKKGLGKHGERVKQYFNNWKIPERKIILDLKGTPFQIQTWKALLLIPPGSLVSYQDVASMVNRPNASRATGTAIGNNQVAYLIPCHRVILNSGRTGGYRWGNHRKIAINGYEYAMFRNQPSLDLT